MVYHYLVLLFMVEQDMRLFERNIASCTRATSKAAPTFPLKLIGCAKASPDFQFNLKPFFLM